eukprot:TRINITY_DN2082_c0_g1_i27.p2 TRINITY_DN2082_c0_g1~~TRINITY_DN2082_c0_g1_i27.p2  ORF type:complete len:151 (-),score=39.53 TRINITY_DN2082_c0_g1_i27:17-469(-)
MVEGEVRDPVSKSFWKALLERAHRNTEIYREIFACDPDDAARTVAELRKLREEVRRRPQREQLTIYHQLKDEIKGHVVEWPTHFMENEDLTLSWTQLESLLPQETYLCPIILFPRLLLRYTALGVLGLSLIHICRCRRSTLCRSRWSPYH